MDKSKAVLVGLLLLLPLPATTFARIGETPTQCEARYGKAVRTDKDTGLVTFLKSGFFIMVRFHQGKADSIAYSKEQRDMKMSDNEIETLLKANSGGEKWKKIGIISMKQQWQTENGLLFAIFDTFDNMLLVFTKECFEREKAREKAKEDKKLDGF